MVIGRCYTLDELMSEGGNEAYSSASGAGLPNSQNIPRENLKRYIPPTSSSRAST